MTSRCYMSQESVATEVRPVYLFLRDGVKRRFLFNTGCSDFVYLKKNVNYTFERVLHVFGVK